MLKKIVAAVGYDIPIQELFDLAIGTSTGMRLRIQCGHTKADCEF